MSLYERVAVTPVGARGLAAARLRREVRKLLYRAVETSGGPSAFARAAGVRTGRVRRVLDGNGDVRVGFLADWAHAAGYEIELKLVPAGQPRADVLARRAEAMQYRDIGSLDEIDRERP